MLHQTFLFLGQLCQWFEVSQILEFLRYEGGLAISVDPDQTLLQQTVKHLSDQDLHC